MSSLNVIYEEDKYNIFNWCFLLVPAIRFRDNARRCVIIAGSFIRNHTPYPSLYLLAVLISPIFDWCLGVSNKHSEIGMLASPIVLWYAKPLYKSLQSISFYCQPRRTCEKCKICLCFNIIGEWLSDHNNKRRLGRKKCSLEVN